jgi:hypothetical protein
MGQTEITLTGHYPSGVFQNPRFVRGGSVPAITACALDPVGEVLVLFQDKFETGDAPYRILPAAGQGMLLDGLLVRKGSGYLLLAKYAASHLGVSQRTDLRGETSAGGVLRCLWLDADFRAVDSAFSPFGDSAIFEFDADASNERIYLLATTTHGYAATAAEMRDQAWHWIDPGKAAQKNETLFAPAICAQGESAVMVFLNASESGSRSILRRRISLQSR